MSKEMIDHPKHYNMGRYEAIDVIEDWNLGFNLGNTIKYISRAGHKDKDKTIEDLKKHLNVDHSEDDAYIKELIEVAEDHVAAILNAPLDNYVDGENLKASVKHAVRLLVGTWYASRESVAFATPSVLPDGVYALLMPLRKFVTEEA